MEQQNRLSRRGAIKISLFGLIAVSIPSIVYSKEIIEINPVINYDGDLSNRYPSIDDEIVFEVKNDKVVSLTVVEPDLVLKAKKVLHREIEKW